VPDAQAGRLPMHTVVPRLSATPGALRRPAPALGEHNAELLRGLGCAEDEIRRLSEAGVLSS
jgi:crotonobetainyl-CoA:carnitine CoA-transferase CaiB-like acyl-CoA transferase